MGRWLLQEHVCAFSSVQWSSFTTIYVLTRAGSFRQTFCLPTGQPRLDLATIVTSHLNGHLDIILDPVLREPRYARVPLGPMHCDHSPKKSLLQACRLGSIDINSNSVFALVTLLFEHTITPFYA
jgi:hypothetical protein